MLLYLLSQPSRALPFAACDANPEYRGMEDRKAMVVPHMGFVSQSPWSLLSLLPYCRFDEVMLLKKKVQSQCLKVQM